ncbi:MAG: putative lipid II flippase FtsW [Gammaproteobacteria bacterium]|nr:putative lipid II flippase FtsW [Gammaproteobacteria bacterium]
MSAGVTSITRARTAQRKVAQRRSANTRYAVLLLVPVALLTVIGLGAIRSASSVVGIELYGDGWVYFKKQALWVGIGVIVAIIAARVPYRVYRKAAGPLLIASIVGLIAVLQFGVVAGGSRRWIEIGSLTFQPSEFAKFSVVVYLAAALERKERLLGDMWHLAVPLGVSGGIAVLLVLLEPDLGTALVIFGAAFAVAAVSAARFRHLAVTALGGSAAALLLAIVSPYRRERLTSFLHPFADPLGSGWQVVQSYVALGTGGAFGVGLGASRARWSFLPNAHTDFIFAIIGEETGFAGGVTVLAMFALIGVIGYLIAIRAPDRFGRMLAVGIVSWLSLQALVNLGGVVGLLPITGMPLPFMSVGGSSLVTAFGAVGVLVNIARNGANPTT